jgi:hypothetical protein
MVKIIYNAKQNPSGIGAILIQQKSSTKTLMISDNSYTNCNEFLLKKSIRAPDLTAQKSNENQTSKRC